MSKTLFVLSGSNITTDIKSKESLFWMSLSRLYHSVIEKRKNIFSEKVSLGFDTGNIIDLTVSTIIKLQPVWN